MTGQCRIAIVGGGIAGVAAAYELALLAGQGAQLEVTLFEASPRLGGIVETVHEAGFTIECGPDGWVTEKPWARALAEELGLADQIISSNDATRKTYVLVEQSLLAMPDHMRMMAPAGLAALAALEKSQSQDASASHPLFSPQAIVAYRGEVTRADALKAAAPAADESVASFIRRHFGDEVLEKIGAPLLSGVFGGDVARLSVRAVMAPFVAMEREHGSLILALEARAVAKQSRTTVGSEGHGEPSVFTTLRTGLGTLIDRMATTITASSTVTIRLKTAVTGIARAQAGWQIETAAGQERFDRLLLAAPVDVAQRLLAPRDADVAALIEMEASSAVVAAFGFTGEAARSLSIPPGFGFLIPPKAQTSTQTNALLAATFVDQKFEGRVPPGGRLLRAFFGGATADRLLDHSDEAIAEIARGELAGILGAIPEPLLTVVRRWPRALPQYGVGHLERMARLDERVQALGNLWLLGNGYRGVGLPDLVRDSRAAARAAVRP